MKLGIVSDIHGNITALEAALSHMENVDQLICLGDSISQFAFSNPVVRALRDLDATVLRGNHEEAFFETHHLENQKTTKADPDLLAWLARRPTQLSLTACRQRVFMAHATPHQDDWRYLMPHTPAFVELTAVEADVILYGHTHISMAKRFGSKIVINPGSTGESRFIDGDQLYSCATVDLHLKIVRIIEFDLSRNAKRRIQEIEF